jgi:hypothetical protein
MSAGAFLDAFYETNFGETIRIKIQPETAALVVQGNTNTIPSGANATNEYANVSSRRRRGVNFHPTSPQGDGNGQHTRRGNRAASATFIPLPRKGTETPPV